MSASTPWTTTPRRERMPAAAGSVAEAVESQHWRSPVEQALAGVEVGCGATETVEVATARRATQKTKKLARVCILTLKRLEQLNTAGRVA